MPQQMWLESRLGIKKEIRKKVEEELSDIEYCNLQITIDDYYMTTAEEV